MKLEANAKKLLDKADEEGKVTFELFTEDPRIKKVVKPVKQKKEPHAIKTEEGAKAAQPASDSKDPKVLVAYLEEQLKSAPDMLVAYLGEQLKQAKEAVAAAEPPSAPAVKKEDSSSSEGSSAMSESDSDSDAPPEETSIKLSVPISVPPPKREAPATKFVKAICQAFNKTGSCRFGKRCRYSHDRNATNQPRPPKTAPKAGSKPARKSLHEVVSTFLE